VLDWLAGGADVNGHTVIGDGVAEPSLESTVLDLQVDAETRKMLRTPETGDQADSGKAVPTPEDKKDSSSAAADILSRYLDRRR
jgi:hypothetical protein